MCDTWADEFERKDPAASAPKRVLDPGLARDGIALFRTLPATAEREVLLCTDLHAGNVLAARRKPWLVIDPKPHLGDPTYDPLQHMSLAACRSRPAGRGWPTSLAALHPPNHQPGPTWG
jgi:streptomycin 6-kinase